MHAEPGVCAAELEGKKLSFQQTSDGAKPFLINLLDRFAQYTLCDKMLSRLMRTLFKVKAGSFRVRYSDKMLTV